VARPAAGDRVHRIRRAGFDLPDPRAFFGGSPGFCTGPAVGKLPNATRVT
jgi:hypothetical protein